MPILLRLPSIEAIKKDFRLSNTFEVRVARTNSIEKDLIYLRACVLSGTPLPERFYRIRRHSERDELLEKEGLMHLHVGSSKADLLFVYQFDVAVVAVALTDHSPFQQRPVAGSLISRHQAAIQKWKADHQAASLARRAERATSIKAGIKPRKE